MICKCNFAAPVLSHLISLFVTFGILSNTCKTAKVLPLFKRKEKWVVQLSPYIYIDIKYLKKLLYI